MKTSFERIKNKFIVSIIIAVLLVMSYNKIMIDNPEIVDKFLDIDLGIDFKTETEDRILNEEDSMEKTEDSMEKTEDKVQNSQVGNQETVPAFSGISALSENTNQSQNTDDKNLSELISNLTEKIDQLENEINAKKNTENLSENFVRLPNSPIHSNADSLNSVALTFDCQSGSDKTEEILRILKNRDIHSTFFIEKDWAKKYLSSIDQILYDGNEIGYLDLKETELLYDETFDSIFIANFATSTKPFYRSYKTNELELIPILEKNGTKLILWSLNGDDYKSNLNEIEEITSAGDIIRFDCSDIRMIDFLPDYILYLKDNNLNPVKVSELF